MTPQQAFDEMNFVLNRAKWQSGRLYIFVDNMLTLPGNICLEMQGDDIYILASSLPKRRKSI